MKTRCLLAAWLGILTCVSTALPAGSSTVGDSAPIKLIDHEVIDTQGHTLKLVSDAMEDRIVVMNFIYTDCTTVCPVSTRIMKAVQQKINAAPELSGKVRLITLTLNPSADTPSKLRRFSKQYGDSGNDWLWLTGSSPAVNEALLGLRAYTAEIETHTGVILVGSARNNHWTSFYQFPDADNIIDRIQDYLDVEDLG